MTIQEYKDDKLSKANVQQPDPLVSALALLKADYELWIQHPTDQFLEDILDRCKTLIKIYENHSIQR